MYDEIAETLHALAVTPIPGGDAAGNPQLRRNAMTKRQRAVLKCEHGALRHALAILSDALYTPRFPGVAIHPTGEGLGVTVRNDDAFMTVHIPGSAANAPQITLARGKLDEALADDGGEQPVEISGLIRPTLKRGIVRARLKAYPDVGYPLPPATDWTLASFDRARFVAAARSVVVAASHEEEPRILNGVYVGLGRDGLNLIATDSVRLGFERLPMAAQPLRTVTGFVPPKTLEALLKHGVAPTVELGAGAGGWLTLTCGDITIASCLPAQKLPRYEQVLPTAAPAHVVFDRADALALARRSAELAEIVGTPVVELTLTTASLSLAPRGSHRGGFGPAIEARTSGFGDERRLLFTCRLLLDAIESVRTKQVVMHLVDPDNPLAPTVFTGSVDALADGSAYRHVLQPARLTTGLDALDTTQRVRFTCPATALADAIATAERAVDPEREPPLSVIAVKASPDSADVHAAGLSVDVTVDVPVTAHAGNASYALYLHPAKLRRLIELLSDGQPDCQATIAANGSVDVGLQLAGYDVPLTTVAVTGEYTRVDMPEAAAMIDGATYARELERILLATTREEGEPPMCHCVQLELQGDTVVLAAHDRFQLGYARVPAERLAVPASKPRGMVDGALLARFAPRVGTDRVRIGWTDDRVRLSFGQVDVVARQEVVGGISFELVLPRDSAGRVTFDRQSLLAQASAADERCVLVAEPGTEIVAYPPYVINACGSFADDDEITLHLPVGKAPILVTTRDCTPQDDPPFRFAFMPKRDDDTTEGEAK